MATVIRTSLFIALWLAAAGGDPVRAEEPLRTWCEGTGREPIIGKYIGKFDSFIAVKSRTDFHLQIAEKDLSAADRKYLESNPENLFLKPYVAGPLSQEAQKLGPAIDPFVQLYFQTEFYSQSSNGLVIHVDGDEAYICVVGHWDYKGKDFEAVVPRKDREKRIKLKQYGVVKIMFADMLRDCPILVGPRSELPGPIKIPATMFVDPVGTKLLVVSDVAPFSRKEWNVERHVLPGTITAREAPEFHSRDEKKPADRRAIDFYTKEPIYRGLVVNEQGELRYVFGWTSVEVKTDEHRHAPLFPLDFFASVKVGILYARRVGDPTTPSNLEPDKFAPDKVSLDLSLWSLPGAVKKLVVKTAPLPAGEDAEERLAGFLRSLDTAEPPKLVELGELQKSDAQFVPRMRMEASQYLPADAKPQSYSFSAPAPAELLAGQSIALVFYLRDENGREELVRSLTMTLPLPKRRSGKIERRD